jgi:carboxymethylenebutenolidase
LASEFKAKSAEAAVNTMVERLSVNHVPVMTGGVRAQAVDALLRQLLHPANASGYGDHPHLPHDRPRPPCRWVVFKFTHTLQMDWLLPGVAPTNKPVEVVKLVIVHFKDGKDL